MRKRSRKPEAQGSLFDLPLDSQARQAPGGERASPEADDGQVPHVGLTDRSAGLRHEGEDEPPPVPFASIRSRIVAASTDLLVLLAVAVGVVAGLTLMRVPVSLDSWAPLSILLLVFSFTYTLLSLAFWGQTPGMAWAGIGARSLDGQPLSFAQSSWRWLAAILTLALACLPLLLAIRGRSLADRLSGSQTLRR